MDRRRFLFGAAATTATLTSPACVAWFARWFDSKRFFDMGRGRKKEPWIPAQWDGLDREGSYSLWQGNTEPISFREQYIRACEMYHKEWGGNGPLRFYPETEA